MTQPTNQVSLAQWLRSGTLRITRIHFFYVAALAVQILIYDAWNVLTPADVLGRWLIAGGLLVITALSWALAHSQSKTARFYSSLIYLLIAADTLVATFAVYSQRGMASRAVFLYAIPIVVSAILLSRVALYATAIVSIAAYVTAAVAYFTRYFNEGYKAELYGEVGFYSAVFLLLASLLAAIIHFKNASKD